MFYCSIGNINTACTDSYGRTQTQCFSTAILTPAHLAASTASQQWSFRANQKLDMETHALPSPRRWAMRPSLQAMSQVDTETQYLSLQALCANTSSLTKSSQIESSSFVTVSVTVSWTWWSTTKWGSSSTAWKKTAERTTGAGCVCVAARDRLW